MMIRMQEEKQNMERAEKYSSQQQLNRIKNINQIREIAKAYPSIKSKKNSYTDFSIKANNYYY